MFLFEIKLTGLCFSLQLTKRRTCELDMQNTEVVMAKFGQLKDLVSEAKKEKELSMHLQKETEKKRSTAKYNQNSSHNEIVVISRKNLSCDPTLFNPLFFSFFQYACHQHTKTRPLTYLFDTKFSIFLPHRPVSLVGNDSVMNK